MQSALTGHLVFSTLHTNDSPSAITRLVDIGVEPFLISSSVLAVFAQRLVRMLCRECKQPTNPQKVYLQSIGVRPEQFANAAIFKAVGCEKCFQTGYRGRIGIFEIMRMSEELRGLILQTFDSNRSSRNPSFPSRDQALLFPTHHPECGVTSFVFQVTSSFMYLFQVDIFLVVFTTATVKGQVTC